MELLLKTYGCCEIFSNDSVANHFTRREKRSCEDDTASSFAVEGKARIFEHIDGVLKRSCRPATALQ